MVQANDAAKGVSQFTHTLIVMRSNTLTLLPASLPMGTIGVAYSAQLNTIGGGAPYTYSVYQGDLPDGLTLSSGGLISGT
jgi:hypothetical protein